MASDGGKGSAPRPFGVNQDTFASNWDAIFGKKDKPETIPMPGTIGGAKLVFPSDADDKVTRNNEETQQVKHYE